MSFTTREHPMIATAATLSPSPVSPRGSAGSVLDLGASGSQDARHAPSDRSAVSWMTAVAMGLLVFLAVVAGARLGEVGAVDVDVPPVAVVVQPGDSVWTVVRSVVPDGDVRSVVAQIHADREGRLLQPGEVVWVPVGS